MTEQSGRFMAGTVVTGTGLVVEAQAELVAGTTMLAEVAVAEDINSGTIIAIGRTTGSPFPGSSGPKQPLWIPLSLSTSMASIIGTAPSTRSAASIQLNVATRIKTMVAMTMAAPTLAMATLAIGMVGQSGH